LRLRFDHFEFDAEQGELYRDGTRVVLQEKPRQLLAALLARPGDIATRDELRSLLWGTDTFVDFEHGLNTAIKRLRQVLQDSADRPRFIETVPRRGYRFIAPVVALNEADLPDVDAPGVGATHGSPLPIKSIVVLPLENLSPEPEQEYFAAGITDALITDLGKIGALRVISRTTAMRFKDTTKTLPEIARELNVDAVIDGSVLRSGNRVRVTANLLHALTDDHLWASSYESELKDVLGLQGELARAIAEQVRIRLSSEEDTRLKLTRPVNPEAYEAYLKGNYARKRSAAGLLTGIQHFRDAIAKDQGYAEAYVGLALLYIQMGFGYGPLSPLDALAEAKHVAQQALKLDATLAEAISCVAWVEAFGDWDWRAADEDFRRAVEISPRSVEAHRLYSWYLSAMGRSEEAIAQSVLAYELEPASLATGYAVAAAYWWSRQYELAAAESEKLEQMDPTFPGAHRIRGVVCLQAGSLEQAIRHFQREVALCADELPTWAMAHLGCAYGRSENSAEAHRLLDMLQAGSKHRYVSPYLFAILHTSIGNEMKALEWLDSACVERNPMLAFLRVDPLLDALRPRAEFRQVVCRMGFPM